jgi:uncharacterized protein YutE (UPF0331/DUF86 family)
MLFCAVGLASRAKSLDRDIVLSAFAISIAPSTGLRNRLVREYEKVNDEIVFNSINMFTTLYKKYISIIFKYIEENELK